MIQVLLWAPLAAGLLACAMPQRLTGWVAVLGSLVTLVLGIVVVAGFDPSGGLQHTVQLAESNLKNIQGFTGPLGQRGPAIVSKLDSSIGQLDELLIQFTEFGKNLNRREGSFGRFLNDPDLYQNLNSAAINIEKLTCELRPIIGDVRVITDKVARHPEVVIRGVFRPSSGIK